MTSWTPPLLDAVAGADELRIGPLLSSRSAHVPIWVVRVDNALYVRSFRGADARWYRRVTSRGAATAVSAGLAFDVDIHPVGEELRDRIDAAYREKYGRYGAAYLTPMTAKAAVDTTLRLTPR
ncbi:DUF2255 family protein [Rathayibacter sp. VKM Ac-2760]|uniref:DUF2255 family protein n=1 Tax=Rathayibacter sp. VKM Ac-2760 TaxID=2609253 RepID=UPI001316F9D9|nr:DUF2255 family protein [Rathayibacter sp. VKM Ac-2760]QHC58723.1 DUF2255 family protein [Rathayibacter sp. VKM Ac-2760]